MLNSNVYFGLTKQISSHSFCIPYVYVHNIEWERIKHRENESDEPLKVTYKSRSPSLGNWERDVYCVLQTIRTHTMTTNCCMITTNSTTGDAIISKWQLAVVMCCTMFHTKWMHIFHVTHFTDANSGTIELFICVIVCWTMNHLAAILKTTFVTNLKHFFYLEKMKDWKHLQILFFFKLNCFTVILMSILDCNSLWLFSENSEASVKKGKKQQLMIQFSFW